MIDLHCHILPGVDDGPPDPAGSVALAEALIEDGVHIVVATPHVRGAAPSARPHEIAARCTELSALLDDMSTPLKVLPGAELELLWALEAPDEALAQTSYGQLGQVLLIETPYGELPPSFEQLLYQLGLRGYRLLLAHPERNPTFQRHPQRLAELVRGGVGTQVTAGSMKRSLRSGSARLATWLLRRSLVTVLATDAHAASGSRAPGLSAGLAHVEQEAPSLLPRLRSTVPEAIVGGRNFVAAPPGHRRRGRGRWARVLVSKRG